MEKTENKRKHLRQRLEERKHRRQGAMLTPAEIREHLDKYVIGQEQAKITLSVAVYEHLQALAAREKENLAPDSVRLPKNNILLFGPTGCGKTHLLNQVAKVAGVPFLEVNAPAYSPTGYKGTNISHILEELLAKTHGDARQAERAIIFFDELDKKASKPGIQSFPDAAYCAEFQHDLLKMVEGATYEVGDDLLDTSGILFVMAGAFVGLDQVVRRRLEREQPAPVKRLGFAAPAVTAKINARVNAKADAQADAQEGCQAKPAGAQAKAADLLAQVTPEDFVEYGIITELTGRTPVLCRILQLTTEELVRIMTDGRESILRAYEGLFNAMNVDLAFTPEALREVAERARKRKMGARALNAILEQLLAPFISDYEDEDGLRRTLTITAAYVRGQGKAQVAINATQTVNDPENGV